MKRSLFLFLGLATLVLLLSVAPTDAAKKKKKAKTAKVSAVDEMRCGVCMATVEEIQSEIKKTENSTNTLDLRWGLTAEVNEGKAKRLGKVIPYKRSELRSIEIMEKVCETMKNFGSYRGVKDEVQLWNTADLRNMPKKHTKSGEDAKTERKRFERLCEELIENSETTIPEYVKQEMNTTEMVDALCFGEASSPCGAKRSQCHAGSYGSHMGLKPCKLCDHGSFQGQAGQTSCELCGSGKNTTEMGSIEGSVCLKICDAGSFSATGLEPCDQCGVGTFQEQNGQKSCIPCADGKSTEGEGTPLEQSCKSICGDNRTSTEEGCDDGNLEDGDGCDSKCQREAGFQCSHQVGARSSCSKVVCGDGKVELDELCDDENEQNGDGCSSDCAVEDGFICKARGPGFKSTCKAVECGDGVKEKSGGKSEGCDDGNKVDGDGCSSECNIEEDWECIEGSIRSQAFGFGEGFFSREKDRCVSKALCGDGRTSGAEKCDDSNTESGDGCSATCEIEEGYTCSGTVCSKEAKKGGFFSNIFGGGNKNKDL